MKFTDITIRNLKPEGKKYYRREQNGFAICVYPSEVKTWFFIFTMDGRRYSMSLGNYPDVSLADARLKYNAAWALYSAGKNPATVERDAQDERRRMPTVKELVADYIQYYAKPKKKSWKEDERALNKDVIPLWAHRKVADITKFDANQLLKGIVDRGSPIQSNNVLEVARVMFNYAKGEGYIEENPFGEIKPKGKKVKRNRFLTADEIKIFWDNIAKCGMTEEMRNAMKLVLVTAQRPGEVIGMHRSEIDGHWWTIPPERTKNELRHRVYLSELALELIGKKEGFIFESPRCDEEEEIYQAIDVNAMATAVRRNCPTDCCNDCTTCQDKECLKDERPLAEKNKWGIPFFRPHDLRRTASTHMARLKIPFEYREAILNHRRDTLDGTYNLHDYDQEKKQALMKWGRELRRIIAGEQETGKVVAIS